jgi:transcriptional regulator with XRE-family HTH domain
MAQATLDEPSKLAKIIGDNVRTIRLSKQLTLRDIEIATGMHYPSLSKIEHGHANIRVKTLELLADSLDVQAHTLLIDGYAAKNFK